MRFAVRAGQTVRQRGARRARARGRRRGRRRPRARARCGAPWRASKRSPVTKSRRAWRSPIARRTNGEITAGRIPSLTSENPNTVSGWASATSAQATSPAPPPSACPWAATTTGAGQACDRLEHHPHPRRAREVLVVREPARASHPADVRARREARALAAQHDSTRVADVCEGSRQLVCGEVVERVPRLRAGEGDVEDGAVACRARRGHVVTLHPEDAERRSSGTGAFAAAARPEREHAPRVERVDDAVVPEARGRRSTGYPRARTWRGSRRGRRRRPSRAPSPPARRPSRRSARSATSRAGAGRRPARTWRSCPRRSEPPVTTVNFGTSAQATAVTSFAPSRAMPASSASLPTMKPVMFCRKTSGIRRLQASSTKCAPFLGRLREEDAAVGEDPDRVALDAREAADEGVAVERLELVEAAAVDDPRDHLERVELVAEVLGDDPVEVGRDRRRAARAPRSPRGAAAGSPRWRTIWRASASACSSEVA